MNVACNDVIWLILQRIPLNELLTCRLVCVRWNSIIQKLCQSKKALLLCSHNSDEFQIQSVRAFNASSIDEKEEEEKEQPVETLFIRQVNEDDSDDNCGHVPVLCPNVSKLIVIDDFYQPKLCQTPHFVSSWADTLTSLTLHGLSFSNQNLAESINTLPWLTELHLLYIYDRLDLTKVQIFPQLTSLSVVRYYGDIEWVLSRLGSHCTRLVLDKVLLTSDQLNSVVKTNGSFCSHLQHLSIGPLCVTEQADLEPTLATICRSFKAIQYLYVDFAFQLPVEEIFFNLAQLPQLNALKLTIDCEVLDENDPVRHHRRSGGRQLRSVTRLHLNLLHSPASIDQMASTLALIFPALQQVKVRSDQRTLISQLERIWPVCCSAVPLPSLHLSSPQ